MNVRCANGDAPLRIAGSGKFIGSNFRGMMWDDVDSPRSMGRLSYDARTDLWSVLETHGMQNVYVVWSYGTPIGWRLPSGEWVRPAEKFSRTTSRHQSWLSKAVVIAGSINL